MVAQNLGPEGSSDFHAMHAHFHCTLPSYAHTSVALFHSARALPLHPSILHALPLHSPPTFATVNLHIDIKICHHKPEYMFQSCLAGTCISFTVRIKFNLRNIPFKVLTNSDITNSDTIAMYMYI